MSSAHANIQDEINEQKKKFKDMTPKQKFRYFWDYYKIPTLVIIVAVIFTVTFVRDYIEGQKETLLYATLINSNPMNDYEQLAADFADYAGIDLEQNHVIFDSSVQFSTENYQMEMASTQKMMTMASAGTMDVVLADEETFSNYTDAGYFYDLRTVLDAELLKTYEDSLYYYTYDPKAARAKAEEAGVKYEESNGPYDTLEPVPIGIRLTKLHNLPEGTFLNSGCQIFGICANSEHVDQAVTFLHFLEGQ
ncbi:MAG: hypothetical protein GX234_00480 [Clostridiales bacterium]|nr:hypothetical protein [Clostridiales bacterium]